MVLPTFIIEHLDQEFFAWSQHEYLHILEQISPCHCILTNFAYPIPNDWPEEVKSRLTIFSCSLAHLDHIPKDQICLLDSEATTLLAPSDRTKFDYFLLGGILGNVDEFDFDRTRVLRNVGYANRNIGTMQMPTDTAAICTKKIIVDEMPFEQLKFVDRPEFPIGANERLIMDFRYLAGNDGLPIIRPEVLDLILKQDLDLDFLE